MIWDSPPARHVLPYLLASSLLLFLSSITPPCWPSPECAGHEDTCPWPWIQKVTSSMRSTPSPYINHSPSPQPHISNLLFLLSGTHTTFQHGYIYALLSVYHLSPAGFSSAQPELCFVSMPTWNTTCTQSVLMG